MSIVTHIRRLRFLAGLTAVALAAGCSSTKDVDEGLPSRVFAPAPQPPPLLNGAAALLLTNQPPFSARMTITSGEGANEVKVGAGELLGLNSQLWFGPAFTDPIDAPLRKAGISFLWRTAAGSGFIFSEPLQGYAPVSPRTRYTGITVTPVQGPAESIDGHRCTPAEARAMADDGTETVFKFWAAEDLNGFPMRVVMPGASPTTYTLTRVKVEMPNAGMFELPEGFTKYQTPEHLMSELGLREQNLRRRR